MGAWGVASAVGQFLALLCLEETLEVGIGLGVWI